MADDTILGAGPLGFPWTTFDPFLFCVHHVDHYPEGNEHMGPKASLEGRRIGMDFDNVDGWNMYHGDKIPGFPRHPHRGFETVTIARRGFIDHSDSMGATARFGQGDVQWMTAGGGVVHCEMFPLRNQDEKNPAELFQIWLNLPAKNKLCEPHFTMLWDEGVPKARIEDAEGRGTQVVLAAGRMPGLDAPSPPPPKSWASEPEGHVRIFTLAMEAGASFDLPTAPEGVNRTLYFFAGESLQLGDALLDQHGLVRLRPEREVRLKNGATPAEVLVLEGMPIGEPVAHHGPFVMNTRAELQQAFADYQRTEFGGWPWESDGPVHPREKGRFAVHADGKVETP